jgi:iron complex transport system ATP-binding protein
MSAVLEALSVSVRAGAARLLDDVTLSFAAGETVALVGPNGAGKSTLVRCLAGELAPVSGQVRLRGKPLQTYTPALLAGHRAVLSQRVNVAFPFTVAEIAGMGANRRSGTGVEALVEATLAELDMLDLADRSITSLSGGEQQRAHFARVLVQHACGSEDGGDGVLLLDEPTAALDLRHQLDMIDALRKRAKRGALVIAILHDLNLAALLAERVVVLDRGRLDCDAPPDGAITDAMLQRVFRVETTVSRSPTSGVPFVLPQAMKSLKALSVT